jgi:hypothetical protein
MLADKFEYQLTDSCGKDEATCLTAAQCSNALWGRLRKQRAAAIGARTRAPVAPSAIKDEIRYWPQTLEPVVQTNGTTTPVKQVV